MEKITILNHDLGEYCVDGVFLYFFQASFKQFPRSLDCKL